MAKALGQFHPLTHTHTHPLMELPFKMLAFQSGATQGPDTPN